MCRPCRPFSGRRACLGAAELTNEAVRSGLSCHSGARRSYFTCQISKQVTDCRSRLFRLFTGRGGPSSVALARDVNTILDAVIFKRGKARGYFAIPKHFAIACVGASVAIAFLNDLDAIFLAFQSQREQKRYRYLRGGNAFVSYNASVRLVCYDVRRRR